ncbi:Uncharacterised protein [Bordetella pertussis]|nr:Uncharacterised protein [Bordetella pertussis]
MKVNTGTTRKNSTSAMASLRPPRLGRTPSPS